MDTPVTKKAPARKAATQNTDQAQSNVTVRSSSSLTKEQCIMAAFPSCIRRGDLANADAVADQAIALGNALYNKLAKK